jgi:phospho-N-acetylmuramoyl-pentapeptide-transferase
MIHWLAQFLQARIASLTFLRVLEYITVRTALALITAFVVSLALGPWLIGVLRRKKAGAQILKIKKEGAPDLHEMHKAKQGTPIMGGLLILIAVVTATLLCCDLRSRMVWVTLCASVALGAIGFYDDYVKVTMLDPRGIPARVKIVGQILVGLAVGLFLYLADEKLGIVYYQAGKPGIGAAGATHLVFPFFKNWYPDLGWGIIPFAILVIVATSNAVNLTDGLDGLAIGVTTIVAAAFLVVTYLITRGDYARYLMFPYIMQGGELVVVLGALIGASLGFLWFNSHPAEVFMGDTGSLLVGGLLGTIALLIKQEFLLVIVGGIFVIEALSVILQVGSYKLRGKRIFLMSPLHHHFQKAGLAESKIIARFWIVAALLALIGLATLKIR